MYAKTTEEKSIASPICFVCACTFPWVKGRRGNQVSWVKPFQADTEDPEKVSHFGGWSMREVKWRFSVEAYLREYRHEPGNAALDLVKDAWRGNDFEDWQVTVPTPAGDVNIL